MLELSYEFRYGIYNTVVTCSVLVCMYSMYVQYSVVHVHASSMRTRVLSNILVPASNDYIVLIHT